MDNTNPVPTTPTTPTGSGPMVGTIIVVIILIVGAIYLWTTRDAKAPETPAPNENTFQTDQIGADLDVSGTMETGDEIEVQ